MADSILRLKVDSQEYDQKIKRAAEGIQQYAQKCRDAGGTLQYLDDGVLEFVQALGKMDTVATGTKQQLREMSNALTTLTQTYRGLTDEEKSSPFGQELAKGIQQLTERAGQAQDAMADVQASIRNAASDTRLFDQMAQGISVATAGFQGLTGAGKLLGIEIGNDVEVIAKLQAAMAVTNSLTTIQTALQKQSALMQGVQAVQAAAAAAAQTTFAEATGLATVAQRAFNVVANANPYMLLATAAAAVVGTLLAFSDSSDEATDALKKQEAAADNTSDALDRLNWKYDSLIRQQEALGKSSDNIRIAQLEVRQSEASGKFNAALSQGDTETAAKYRKELEDIGRQILDIKKKKEDAAKVTQWFIDEKDFINTRKEINAAISHFKQLQDEVGIGSKKFQEYQRYIDEYTAKLPKSGGGGRSGGGSGAGKQEIQFADDSIMAQERLVAELTQKWKTASGELREGYLKDLNDAQAKLATMTGTAAKVTPPEMTTGTSGFNDQNIANWVSMIKGDLAKADIGSEIYQSLTDNLSDMSRLTTSVKDAIKLGLDIPQDAVEEMFETVFDQGNLPEDMYNDMIDKFIKDFKEKTGKDLELGEGGSLKTGKEKGEKEDKQGKSLVEGIGQLTGGMNQMVSSMEQLGIKIPSGLKDVLGGIQSVCTLLSTISTIVTAIEAISAADMFIPFASGGIVGRAASGLLVGNNMSGDNLRMPVLGGSGGMIGINDGELILNRAQQGIIADSLQGGGLENLNLETIITAEDLIVMLNNNANRRGMEPFIKD